MRKTLALAIVGLCLLSGGCSGPITLAARTVVIEPIHDWARADNVIEHHRDYRLAEGTWRELVKADPDHVFSSDFVQGFKDGFADYVYAGGTGEPPPLPPRYYWKTRYETPQGHQAIADWFAGFRLGAELARESGYRELVMIPSSTLPMEALSPALSPRVPASPTAPGSETLLPPPRKLTPPSVPKQHHPDGEAPAAPARPAKAGNATAQPALPPQ
jgi:hypothetical protein